jgi:hypothetical protein
MLNKDQSQDVGDGATVIQAGGSVTVNNVGLTYADVRSIAQDVFQANFYKLVGIAKEVARERMEEITEAFLGKLQRENPKGLGRAEDPDFQYALFAVQREYARSGDKDLGDLLVDLLVDRSKHEPRDILQIVLNESLTTASKLTDGHLATLSVIFSIKYAQINGIANHDHFVAELDKYVAPFASHLTRNATCYQHLQFCGCGSLQQLAGKSLEQILSTSYQGLFSNGFHASEISNRSLSIGLDSRFFIPCLNDANRLQVDALNAQDLNSKMEAHALTQDDRFKINQLFELNKMPHTEIVEKVTSIRSYMGGVFEIWRSSPLKSFTLTSVGIAIGHANIKRQIGEFADLSIWIN